MFKSVLKTITASVLALSANWAFAATVPAETSATINNFASVQFDIGAAGVDGALSGTFDGFITDFDYTFAVPKEISLVRVFDLAAPSDAGFVATTNSDPSVSGAGTVFPSAGTGDPTNTVRLQGFVNASSLVLGIDVMELLFSTTTPGLFTVSYRGGYTAFSSPDASTTASFTDSGSFNVRVVDPNAAVIPLPAGGVLMLTAAGAFALMRRRKT